MSEFLPPEKAWFGTSEDGFPIAVLAVGPAAAGSMHAIGSAGPQELKGWQIVARATLTVVDGPDGYGFLVGADPRRFESSAAWADLVAERGGAIVLFVDNDALLGRAPEALPEGQKRGGIVRSL